MQKLGDSASLHPLIPHTHMWRSRVLGMDLMLSTSPPPHTSFTHPPTTHMWRSRVLGMELMLRLGCLAK